MKKVYSILAMVLIAGQGISVMAQQLPNSGFETWVDCYPWSSKTNTDGPYKGTNAQGTTTESWCVSNVYSGISNNTLASSVAGYNKSKCAVELKDKPIVLGTIKQHIPAYVALGTTWSTSNGMAANDKAGGSFGGLDFTYRPDAISFYYKNDAKVSSSMVVAYLWTGTFTQLDVPANIVVFGNPTKTTMIDRDRQVLGMDMAGAQGGETSSTPGAECIAKLQENLPASADWSNAVYEFDYTSDAVPEKINVIFSAGDYFSTTRSTDDANILTVDDVKLIYYSTLKSLTIGGKEITLEDGKYEYEIEGELPETEAEVECGLKGKSAVATVALDKADNKATVTVTAPDADLDGKTSHVYNISFASAPEQPADENTYIYNGKLAIYLQGSSLTGDTPQDATIHINRFAADKCNFSLPDFALGDIKIGDINVPDVELEFNDGIATVKGYVKDLAIGGDETTPDEEKIHATVTVNGTIDAEGKASLKIDVLWAMDGNVENVAEENMIPIEVTFNGTGKAIPASFGTSTAIESIVDDQDAPVEYFNLQGMPVANPENGIYIRRQGNKVTKILIK